MRSLGFYRRGHVWYLRAQIRVRRKLQIPRASPCRAPAKVRKYENVDVSVSMLARDRNGNIELAARLSTYVRGWIERARMLGLLEKMQVEEVRVLVRWALADLRDLYCSRCPVPGAADPLLVSAVAKKLQAEAIAFQAAIDSGDLEIIEGPARALLRRRGVEADIDGPRFQDFLRIVTPSLIEARIAELVRLGAAPALAAGRIVHAAPTLQPVDKSEPPNLSEVALCDRDQGTNPGTSPLSIASRAHRMEDALEDLLRTARRENRLSRKTQVQYRQSAVLLVRILGDLPISQITREMASTFRETVLQLPQKYGQSARYAGLGIPEIIKRADDLRDDKRIIPATYNRHHTALHSILENARLTGKIEKNPFDGLRYRRPKAAIDGSAPHETRFPFGEANLRKFFGSPLFAGMRSDQFRHKPGRIVRHDAYFWLPVLMLALGARPEEIAQLKVSDFAAVEGMDMFRITSHGGRSVKSRSANRWLPITSQLKEIGFLRFVEERRAAGAEFVFEECLPSGRFKKRAVVVGKALNRYLRRVGIEAEEIVLYSLRHDFASTLSANNVDPRIIARLMGHSTGNLAFDTYTSQLERQIFDALDRVNFPALGLVKKYPPKIRTTAMRENPEAHQQVKFNEGS